MRPEEHDRAPEEMGRAFGEKGDVARLERYVAEAVPAWHVAHIQGLDAVAAQLVAMRGG